MAINFNNYPYFDDFNPSDNYHRILFQPGYSVQARELTQAQTIIQNQITQFASAIYSQNTPISGGRVTTNLHCNYVILNKDYSGASIDITGLVGDLVSDSYGIVVATILAVNQNSGLSSIDPVTGKVSGLLPTLIISYHSGQTFYDGMFIYVGGKIIGTSIGSPPVTVGGVTTNGYTSVGKSSVASISAGVYYVLNGHTDIQKNSTNTSYTIGNFVNVLPQTIVLDAYNSQPSARIGLSIIESIVNSSTDTSLLDPAIGASNFQAPGANRYQISLILSSIQNSATDSGSFIELVRLDSGTIIKQVDNTVYSAIDDYFAKRTFETNGDFLVNPFKLTPTKNVADGSKFDIGISKGVAYVGGYRLENQSALTVTGDRARTVDSLYKNNISVDYGTYFYVQNVAGSLTNSFDITTMQSVDLHSAPSANVVTSSTLNSYNSTLIGTAKIRNLEYDTNNSDANTYNWTYKAAVFDIHTNVLTSNVSASNITSTTIKFYDPTSIFSKKNDAYYNVKLTFSTGLLNGYQGKIVSYDGANNIATLDTTFPILPTTSDKFSLNFNISDIETILSVDTNRNILSSATISNKSKAGLLSTGSTTLFDRGAPELLFNIGNSYVQNIANASFDSKLLYRNQPFQNVTGGCQCQILLDTTIINSVDFKGSTGSNLSSDQILNYYTIVVKNKGSNSSLITGQILDFTVGTRRINVSSDKNTITLFSSDLTATTPFTVDIIAKVKITNASDSAQVLKTKRLIKANTSIVSIAGTTVNTNTLVTLTTSAPTNAQVYIKNAGIHTDGTSQSLYVSDVKRVVKIIDTISNIDATTDMISSSVNDVTNHYTFSNGQTDSYYGHASITLKPGFPNTQGNLLVFFDYYDQSGGNGYFNVQSYTSSTLPENYGEIPSYAASNGNLYNLRDCLDFRPTRINATSAFTLNYVNSGSSYAGMLLPDNLSSFICDYTYYLARKDLLVLNKSNKFSLIPGVPAIYPAYPAQPDGSLLISKISVDPYTAYVQGEGAVGSLPNLSIETIQHKRWTMQDISNLQTRINDLEYYTSLNTLEQSATSAQVPDSKGLNRFKNGILVDDFSSFSTADTANKDWSANINKRTRQLSAMQSVTNFPLQDYSLLTTGGNPTTTAGYAVSSVNNTTKIFTLPYTISVVGYQHIASNTININPYAVSIQRGVLDINPPMDNWVDNTKSPDLLIVDPSLQVFQQSSTVNVLSVGDWKTVPGTTSTSVTKLSSSFSRVNHGAFFGPFGGQVGYTQTDTATTTSTYGTLSQQNTLGYYSNINNTYSLNNNYLTDISILPYIRQQQLLIKSAGMLVNTQIQTWFDGVNVDQYMTSPDVVELTNVTGSFMAGDTLGYYVSNIFYPIASVVEVYTYATLSNGSVSVRLYIVGNYHSTYQADTSISRVQNGFYNDSGVYTNSSASGQVSSAKIISVHKSGYIGAVGGTFTDVIGSSLRYYKVAVCHGAFSDKFGIWGSPNSYGSLPAGKFNFNVPTTGKYYIRLSTDDSQSGYVIVDTTTVWTSSLQSGGYNDIAPMTLSAGTHTFSIYCTTSEDDGDAYIAVAISGSPWTSATTTNGPIVLSTDALKSNIAPALSGTQIEMPGGGLYYVGASQVSLNGIANSTDGFYNGSKITFNSVQISLDPYGNSIVSPITQTATISNYIGATCTCTLTPPVNLSVGGNAIIGGSDTTSYYSINGTVPSYKLAIQKGALDSLSTNESGLFIGVFNVPPNVFKTGERVFRIDNRLLPNEPGDSTTYAEGTFTASGLSTKSQALDFGPSISGARNTFNQTSYLSNQLISTDTVVTQSYSPYDPVAQSFMIDKDKYPDGIFLSSISLFFRTKPTVDSSSITLSIVGTLNGYPNGATLDYSIVTLTPDKVNATATPHYLDPNAITTFGFSAPVFIQPGVLYAFILKSASTAYNVFKASQNQTPLASTLKTNYTDATPTTALSPITVPPFLGSIFESQNSITWTADQSSSLMMLLNRCVFTTSAQPKIQFTVNKQLSYRKDLSNSIRSLIDANTFSSVLTTNAGSDVVSDAYNITTTDFIPYGADISYSYLATLNSTKGYANESYIIPGQYGCPTYDDIYLSDGNNERVLLRNTYNSFILYAALRSSSDAVSPILSDDGISLYNTQWKINNLQMSNSQISITNTGSGYSGSAIVTISAPDVSGGTQATATANVVSGAISAITLTNPGSGYLINPTITITGANTTTANATSISEFNNHGGNALCKYFTKKVVLTSENISQDLRVFYTAYKPIGTNIYVFYKLLNDNDPSNFDDNGWQLMTDIGTNKNTFSKNRDDVYEFESAPGQGGVAAGIISYTNSNGQSYNSFIQFAIKVVMTTNDNTTVPFLSDIRALALPSGTGS